MQDCLQELIMNQNPLLELSGLIRYLRNLKVLGIAHSKIQELPPQIANLQLRQIVVENTPLKVPKLVCAERGFEAIKEFFLEQRQRNQDNMITTTEYDGVYENQTQIQKTHTLGGKDMLVNSDSEDDQAIDDMPEDKRFFEYEMRKNKLVSKEFAYAVIDQMKKEQRIDLYDQDKLSEFKDKEHEFVQAYDQVLHNYIKEDKLHLLPHFFKENQLVMNIKDNRRALRFDFPKLQQTGSTEERQQFVHKLNQKMVDNQLNRVIALIRFQNFELFKILIELIKKMDLYRLKFVITYVTTYLDEFLMLCDKKAQIDPKLITFKDEFDPEMQERKKATYEIPINNQIFYNKIGQHPHLMQLFTLLNFKKELNKQSQVLSLRIDKNENNYTGVKEINQLLKLLQSVSF